MRFDNYHPLVNLLYFTVAFICIISFNHPIFLIIGYLIAFVYSVKLGGKKTFLLNILMIPLVFLYGALYASYRHFGITVMAVNFIGNNITFEAFAYGFSVGMRGAAFLMMFRAFVLVFSIDKVIYLLGRICPSMALMVAVLIKSLKDGADKFRKSKEAGRTLGKRGLRGISATVTWSLDRFMECTSSMKCRGLTLRRRSAFSIYRFDLRDRALVILITILIVAVGMAAALDQTWIFYDPEIVMGSITMASWFFYGAYALFLIIPFMAQTIGELRFYVILNKIQKI